MEYVERETPKDRLQGKPTPPRAAAVFLVALARAVAFAPRHGIVHGDLKPHSIPPEAVDECSLAATEQPQYVDPPAELTRPRWAH